MRRDILAMCRKACKVAARLGVEAEAFSVLRTEGETEIEASNITIGVETTDFGVGVRVLKDKRVGFAYTSVPRHIPRTVRKAVSASRFGHEVSYRFAPSAKLRPVKALYDGRLDDMDPERAFLLTKDIVDGAKAVSDDVEVASGGLLYGTERLAVATTRGLEVHEEGSVFSVSASVVVGKGGEAKTSFYDMRTSRALDIGPREVGGRAAAMATSLVGGKDIGGGRMDVLLAPTAAAELFTYTLNPAFHGERVATGESFLKGMMGKRVAWKGLTIRDDALRPGGLGSSMCDDEGVPSRRNLLVRDGVLRGLIYDLATADRYGSRTTGNGLRPGFRGVPSPSCRNLMFEGRRKAFDKMVAGIDRGVLVHDIMGAHTANMASTDFSINSSALFMVEKGEVTHPISSAMISGSLADMLKRLTAMGDDIRCVASGSAFYLGSMLFEDVQITG